MSQEHRCGVVAIAGRPNVGKSTLMNHLLGAKVAIVTPKPQTTRDRILGILTKPGLQVLFHDTPGIHKPQKALNRRMVAEADSALGDCDVVLFVTDADEPVKGLRSDRLVLQRIAACCKPTILAINKIDLIPAQQLLPLIQAYSQAGRFEAVVPISARRGDGTDVMFDELVKFLPEGPALYSEDDLSDRPMRFVAAEIVREKLMMEVRQEIPYSIAVTIDEFLEPEPPAIVRISATIHIERDSQKAIVIGRGGSMLKTVGTAAREEIEHLMDRKVFLQLFVKVDPEWAATDAGVRRMGYE